MSSDGRSRRRELVEEAYQLQVKAGLMARHIPLTDPYHKSTVAFIGIHISVDRERRNMAPLVSALRSSRIVPGLLSSQFPPTSSCE